MAETYRRSFKKIEGERFTKENFDIQPFCSSKHNDANTNMLSRLISSLAHGLNERFKLPKFIVIVMDDDLLRYLQYAAVGATGMLGEWIEWLTSQTVELCRLRTVSLPRKAVKIGYPQIYWATPPHHKNFLDNFGRTKITNAIESVCRTFDNVRMIRMKEIWSYDDVDLVDKYGNIL